MKLEIFIIILVAIVIVFIYLNKWLDKYSEYRRKKRWEETQQGYKKPVKNEKVKPSKNKTVQISYYELRELKRIKKEKRKKMLLIFLMILSGLAMAVIIMGQKRKRR